jgi:hypothetical protein
MKRLNDHLQCREYSKVVSTASVSEKGLTFELDNKSGFEIEKWRIDDCVLKAVDGCKCDYLLVVKNTSTCYWIELKDQDFDDCCLQIYSTIRAIEEVKNYKTHYARIILGRFKEDKNEVDSLKYTNHKKLVNHIGGRQNLEYKTKILTETI